MQKNKEQPSQLSKEKQRQNKNTHITKICSEIDVYQTANNTRDLYKKTKELTRKFKPSQMGRQEGA